jgi:hypothetical protein
MTVLRCEEIGFVTVGLKGLRTKNFEKAHKGI